MQCSVMQCSFVLHRAVLCCILYFGAVYCHIISVVECLLSDAFMSVLWSAVQCRTVYCLAIFILM